MKRQGLVLDIEDPDERFRVKLNIQGLHIEGEGVWCEDLISRSNQGDLPKLNSLVWCEISDIEPNLGFYYGYVQY